MATELDYPSDAFGADLLGSFRKLAFDEILVGIVGCVQAFFSIGRTVLEGNDYFRTALREGSRGFRIFRYGHAAGEIESTEFPTSSPEFRRRP